MKQKEAARRAALALLVLTGLPSLASALPGRDAAWFLSRFGEAPRDARWVQRAYDVFGQVVPVADLPRGPLPRLLVLRKGDAPEALALDDGTIVLNQKALKLCYRGERRTPEEGDARLAFLLGHELHHLAQGQLLHERGFFARLERGRRARPPTDAAPPQRALEPAPNVRDQELLADKAGLHVMLNGGYAAQHLFDAESSFFSEWNALVQSVGQAIDPQTPAPDLREDAVRTQLQDMQRGFDLFHFGTRLLQLRRYRDAATLLEAYARINADAEVLNNLGLAHFQLAAEILAQCDGELVVRYRLPLVVDAETLRDRARLRGSGRSPCYDSTAFSEQVQRATFYFQNAVKSSPRHFASRINLASAFLLRDTASTAYIFADEARELAPDDPLVQTLFTLAEYQFWVVESNRGKPSEYLAKLDEILETSPELPEALFARASILQQLGRSAATKAAWVAYLEVDTASAWADYARERIDGKAEPPADAELPPCGPPTPLALGPVTEDDRTGALVERPLPGVDGATYEGRGLKALQLGDSIEIVERASDGSDHGCGTPRHVVNTSLGKVEVFHSFAVETRRGAPPTVVFFEPVP